MRYAWPFLILIPLLIWWLLPNQNATPTIPLIESASQHFAVSNPSPVKTISPSIEKVSQKARLKEILSRYPIDDTRVEDMEWDEALTEITEWMSNVTDEVIQGTDAQGMLGAMRELYHPEASPYFKYMYFQMELSDMDYNYENSLRVLNLMAQDPFFAPIKSPAMTPKASQIQNMANSIIERRLGDFGGAFDEHIYEKLKKDFSKNPGPATDAILYQLNNR